MICYLISPFRGDSGEPSTSGREAHDGAVTGISSDDCNRLLVTAGASAMPYGTQHKQPACDDEAYVAHALAVG
jgi:hypothetical protein